MGLRQGDTSHPLTRAIAAWLPPAVVAVLAGTAELFGDAGRDALAFDRTGLAAGELWRLVSAHFVHLGVSHLLLNAAGLLLVWYLVSSSFSSSQWLLVTLLVVAGVDAGLWFLEPQLIWYVGLSGLLHGLLAAGIVAGFRPGRIDLLVLGLLVVAKLIYEQLVGPLPGSEQSSGGAVIVASHLYGAIAGVIAAVLIMIRAGRPAAI
jgi:rhomboid family GlyGly-CTERM serine protease